MDDRLINKLVLSSRCHQAFSVTGRQYEMFVPSGEIPLAKIVFLQCSRMITFLAVPSSEAVCTLALVRRDASAPIATSALASR